MYQVFKDIWRFVAPYWQSNERKKAWLLTSSILITVLISIYFQVKINTWAQITFDALQNYQVEKFLNQWLWFGAYLAGFLAANMAQSYVKNKLIIDWRYWLTNHLMGKWLDNKRYYKMQLFKGDTDNPDQRISQDIGEFVTETETVLISSFEKVLTLATFSVILWGLSSNFRIPENWPLLGGQVIPGFLFWVALVYSLLSTYISFKFGASLVRLSFNKEKFEANFRFSMMRIRENTESIALYHSEKAEQSRSFSFYHDILKNMYHIIYWNIRYFAWLNTSVNISNFLPYIVSAPLYFARKIQFGGLMQIGSAMLQVQNSLMYFMTILPQLAAWRAATLRLVGFMDTLESIDKQHGHHKHLKRTHHKNTNSLKVNIQSIDLPNDTILIGHTSLELKQGVSILLSGPSGSGKSTFLRALAGLWPFGQGDLMVPEQKEMFFVPQRPYIPLGTLRDVLVYPYQANSRLFSDDSLRSALEKVNLKKYAGALDEDASWPKRLSLGEQQKISFARLVLHKPKWIFMDETTSSLDEAAEEHVYSLLDKEIPGVTKISVGHRSTIKKFHDKQLYFDNTDGRITFIK